VDGSELRAKVLLAGEWGWSGRRRDRRGRRGYEMAYIKTSFSDTGEKHINSSNNCCRGLTHPRTCQQSLHIPITLCCLPILYRAVNSAMTTVQNKENPGKGFFPLAGVAMDGWSTETEATATCFCGAVQLSFVCRPYRSSVAHGHKSRRTTD
jgi:hypothetical protein